MISNKEKLIENIRNNVKQIVYLQLQEGLFGTKVESLPKKVGILPLYKKILKQKRAEQGKHDSIGKEFFGHLGGGLGQSIAGVARDTGLLGSKSPERLSLSKIGSGLVKGMLPSVARAAMTIVSPSTYFDARNRQAKINQFLRNRRSKVGQYNLELAGEKFKQREAEKEAAAKAARTAQNVAKHDAAAAARAAARARANRERGIISPTDNVSPYALQGQAIPPKELSNPAPTEQPKPKPNPRSAALGKIISKTSSVPTGTIDPNTRRAGYAQTGIEPGSALMISNRYDINRAKLGLKRAVVPDVLTGKNIQIGPLATPGRFRR